MLSSIQLPKSIRDALRMAVALHCYLRQGKGQKLRDLHASMYDLFHTKSSSNQVILSFSMMHPIASKICSMQRQQLQPINQHHPQLNH